MKFNWYLTKELRPERIRSSFVRMRRYEKLLKNSLGCFNWYIAIAIIAYISDIVTNFTKIQ